VRYGASESDVHVCPPSVCSAFPPSARGIRIPQPLSADRTLCDTYTWIRLKLVQRPPCSMLDFGAKQCPNSSPVTVTQLRRLLALLQTAVAIRCLTVRCFCDSLFPLIRSSSTVESKPKTFSTSRRQVWSRLASIAYSAKWVNRFISPAYETSASERRVVKMSHECFLFSEWITYVKT